MDRRRGVELGCGEVSKRHDQHEAASNGQGVSHWVLLHRRRSAESALPGINTSSALPSARADCVIAQLRDCRPRHMPHLPIGRRSRRRAAHQPPSWPLPPRRPERVEGRQRRQRLRGVCRVARQHARGVARASRSQVAHAIGGAGGWRPSASWWCPVPSMAAGAVPAVVLIPVLRFEVAAWAVCLSSWRHPKTS